MVGYLRERGRGVACDGLITRICDQDCWRTNRYKEKVEQKKYHEQNKR